MTKASYRVATQEDIIEFFGSVPMTMVAVAVFAEDQIVAIGGVAHDKGTIKMFMDMKEGAEKYPVTLWKAAKRVMQLAQDHNYRLIYARVTEGLASSKPWLTRLGFEPYYISDEQEIYQWRM